jgi:hypothetical protein
MRFLPLPVPPPIEYLEASPALKLGFHDMESTAVSQGTMTLSIASFSITTLSMTTFSITTLSIKGFYVTYSIRDTQQKRESA